VPVVSKKLIELHLDYNQITRLTGLGALKNLESLSLRDNEVMTSEMQQTISTLVSLKRLWVGNCGLTQVPKSWQRLDCLEEIFIFGNPLTAIPDWLLMLPNLKRLGLVDAADKRTKNRLRKRHQLEIW
jgi:Leucine-rich repeat (LRR) protein